jgi:hypothetical protein
MRNDFKMIVFKQLTISIKTQNDNKIKVSCSANYCFYINSSFVLSYLYIPNHPKYVRHIFFINRILGSLTSDVMNTVTLSTWQYAPNAISCSANQQNVTLHIKHDHQYCRNFKSLNIIWCIVCLSYIYWDTRYQEIRPPFSMLNAKRYIHVRR